MKFSNHTSIIISENFENASIFDQLDFCLQLFCSLIYVFGKIVIHLIKIIIALIKFPDQKNAPDCTSIEKLENQIKDLRTRISWTMDYVQLANQNKDTRALDEFRKNLEKQFDQDPDDENDNNNE